MNTVQILVIVVSCILFFGHLFFGFFKRLSPFHKHSDSSCSPNRHDFDHNQTSTPNNEHYNELNEQDSVNDRQPTHVKKKHRNLFKKKKKKYELFQSVIITNKINTFNFPLLINIKFQLAFCTKFTSWNVIGLTEKSNIKSTC